MIRKQQMQREQKLQEMLAKGFSEFSNNRIELINDRKDVELDANQEMIDAEGDRVDDLERQNEKQQQAIADVADAYADALETIGDKTTEMTNATKNWNYATADLRNSWNGIFTDIIEKYDAAKSKLEKGLEIPAVGSGLALLAKVLGVELPEEVAQGYMPPTTQPAPTVTNPPTAWQDSGASQRPPSRTMKVMSGDPEGVFALQSSLTNRWYRTGTEMANDEAIYRVSQMFGGGSGVTGFATGRHPGFRKTTGRTGGAGDYIAAMLRNDEVVAPMRDFRSLMQDLSYERMAQVAKAINQQNSYVFQIGQVIGMTDLDAKIRTSVEKVNADMGYYNGRYLVRNS